MRCAARHRLLSNNSGATILLVVFVVGALFFALGTVLVRRERRAGPAPERAPESLERIDQLLTAGDATSVAELRRLRDSAQSADIRGAAEDALIVISSRG
jgi:hypothetical protein